MLRRSVLIFGCALAACATPPPAAPPTRPSQSPAPGSIRAPPPPELVIPPSPLQCVPYARARSGVEIYGDAHTWWGQAAGRYRTGRAPEVGAVLVLANYAGPDRGHVAVVTLIVDGRTILVDQANWHNRGEITRNVPVRDDSAANDWSVVRVWHTLEQRWGGRLNEVQGFIMPGRLQAG